MTTEDLIARSRREGARRRALRDGRPPEEAVAGVTLTGPSTAPAATGALGAVTASYGAAGGTPAAAGTLAAGGTPAAAGTPAADATAVPAEPWFDRRGFFLGWLAMVVALLVFQSGFAGTAAGLAVAYLASRRRRLLNAFASVLGGYVAGTIAAIALIAVLFVFAR